MSWRFMISMSLLLTFCVTSLLWAMANDPQFSPTRTWRPSIHVFEGVSQQCVGDVVIGKCIFATDCMDFQSSIIIDGTWYPAGTPRKWALTADDVKGCNAP